MAVNNLGQSAVPEDLGVLCNASVLHHQCEFHAPRIRAAKLHSFINTSSLEKSSMHYMHRWQLAGGFACATSTCDQSIGLPATSLDEAASLAFLTQTLQEHVS